MFAQAGAGDRMSAGGRICGWALVLSVLLHGLVLSLPFDAPPAVPVEPAGTAGIEARLIAPPDRPTPADAPRAVRATAPRTARAAPAVAAPARGEGPEVAGDDSIRSDLHYRTFYDDNPTHPMRCMVGHVAESSGDHESAIYIYGDCAKNGDNFSMISLAHYYELGLGGAPKDPALAAELFRKVATSSREAYRSNGMFYYGLSLYFGYGVARDEAEARQWLARAAAEGDRDAAEFLALAAAGAAPAAARYFKR